MMEEVGGLVLEVWRKNGHVQWAIAGATALTVLLGALALRAWVARRAKALAQTEQVELLELPFEVASKTSRLFIITICLFAGFMLLKAPSELRSKAVTLVNLVGFWQLGVWGTAAVVAWLLARRKAAGDNRAAIGSLGIIGFVLRVVVWALILLLALDNLGVDVTALVAGLGVGGIAVALAVQNVLGDLFASLSITLDRPFEIGDFIIVGEYMGSVEQIGVKSTRLRSLGGEQIIMANADLLGSRLRNYGRMQERRVVFSLGVTYETSRGQLKRIPSIIRQAIEAHDTTRFDRCHFAKYGDFSLQFETVYYVLSADYNVYMDVQQAIYFDIHEAFEREQIEFAYPTQKLWLTRSGAEQRERQATPRSGATNTSLA
jgi:small-conductance mechanosensitive channel